MSVKRTRGGVGCIVSRCVLKRAHPKTRVIEVAMAIQLVMVVVLVVVVLVVVVAMVID